MRLTRFSLFTTDVRGIRCGFEAVEDLETARCRLSQLASANPVEYFGFHLRAKQVLELRDRILPGTRRSSTSSRPS